LIRRIVNDVQSMAARNRRDLGELAIKRD